MDVPALLAKIRSIPDFPKPGILFRDVTPLLLDPVAFQAAAAAMAAPFREAGVERVLGIESRGFLFGAPIALALGVGLGLIRKHGKLPHDTLQARYEVQTLGASPVDVGLAKSLARPEGMVTDLTNLPGEHSAKYLELLLAAVPRVKRVGFLLDRGSPLYAVYMKNARSAVAHHRIEGRFVEAAKAEEIEPALARLAKEGVERLVLSPSPGLFVAERQRILTFALARRWPVISGSQRLVEDGALLCYSADGVALARRAAWYVDRILKGAKPADLPIEQPMKLTSIPLEPKGRNLGRPY